MSLGNMRSNRLKLGRLASEQLKTLLFLEKSASNIKKSLLSKKDQQEMLEVLEQTHQQYCSRISMLKHLTRETT